MLFYMDGSFIMNNDGLYVYNEYWINDVHINSRDILTKDGIVDSC